MCTSINLSIFIWINIYHKIRLSRECKKQNFGVVMAHPGSTGMELPGRRQFFTSSGCRFQGFSALFSQRQGKYKFTPFAWFALNPDGTSMEINKFLTEQKTQTGATFSLCTHGAVLGLYPE